MDLLLYIFKGILHYVNLFFNMIDYKDLNYLFFIIIGFIIIFMINKEVNSSFKGLIKSSIRVVSTFPGFLIFLIFLGYYLYLLKNFDKISIMALVFSFSLILRNFFKVNIELLVESKNTVIDTIKDISLSAIIIFIQQLSLMLEYDNFCKLKLLFMSLLIIPIFSITFIFMKHFCVFEDFYKTNQIFIKLNDFDLFIVFTICILKSRNYKLTCDFLRQYILDNEQLEISSTLNDQKKYLIKYNKKNKIQKKEKINLSGIFELFNDIWLIIILIFIICIIDKRFNSMNYGITYYISYFLLYVYLWYDLMRIKHVENQSDFVIYGFIYILLIIFLIVYEKSLNINRLTELGFMIPIFVFTRYYSRKHLPINFLNLPIISENNFFKLNPDSFNKKS